MMKGLREKDDSTADLFATPERFPLPSNCYFHKGMKLEAVDPLNLSDICVATIMQVCFFFFDIINYNKFLIYTRYAI